MDLETVQADDALLDALGSGTAVPGDDELAAMLGAWRADLDTEPLPALRYDTLPSPAGSGADWAPGPDGETQVLPTVSATHSSRSRRTVVPLRPRTVRLAVAAAVVIATAGGVSVAAAGARPSDPLWPVVKIVHPGVADVRAAQDAIDKARAAVDEHRYDDARLLIDRAATLVAKVRDPQQAQRLRTELDQVRAMLPPSTPGTGRATPTQPHAQTPTPAPSTGATTAPGVTSPSPSTSPSTGHGLLPLLPSLPPLLPSILPHL